MTFEEWADSKFDCNCLEHQKQKAVAQEAWNASREPLTQTGLLLVKKIVEVEEATKGVWGMAYAHGVRYGGPHYGQELTNMADLVGYPLSDEDRARRG